MGNRLPLRVTTHSEQHITRQNAIKNPLPVLQHWERKLHGPLTITKDAAMPFYCKRKGVKLQ